GGLLWAHVWDRDRGGGLSKCENEGSGAPKERSTPDVGTKCPNQPKLWNPKSFTKGKRQR
ncbi:hypothetical protein U1Q18_048804, partial [Sarracenia purpurea var. burkii]